MKACTAGRKIVLKWPWLSPASQTSSALQCIAALSGTRQIMQAVNTDTQHAGGLPVSEARPLDRLRARKFQMNSSTLLFTPAKGSCRQDKHAKFLCCILPGDARHANTVECFRQSHRQEVQCPQTQVMVQASVMLTLLLVGSKVHSGTGLVQWKRQVDDKPFKERL